MPPSRYAANHKLDMSFISDEMEKILQEEQMMESFTRNAEHELEQMFDMVQEEEGQECAVHKKMVGWQFNINSFVSFWYMYDDCMVLSSKVGLIVDI